MKRIKLIWRVYLYFSIMALISLVAMSVYVTFAIKHIYLNRVIHDLTVRAELAAHELNEFSVKTADTFCKKWGNIANTRYTVILPDGVVIGDTRKDPGKMENHRYRPEVIKARSGMIGHSVRFSHTLRYNLVYVAVPVYHRDNLVAIIRTSVPVDTIALTLRVIRMQILIGLGIAAILFSFLGIIVSRLITRPIENIRNVAERLAKGDLTARAEPTGSAETIALAETLNNMAADMQERINIITRQQKELSAVFSSMTEGVVAMDLNMKIIHLNKTAKRWLKINYKDCDNWPLIEVVRNFDFIKLVKKMLKQDVPQEQEFSIRYNDGTVRYFQIHGALLFDEHEKSTGLVIVMSNITRLKRLELMRRGFVADVSHELKTPITAIACSLDTLTEEPHFKDNRFINIMKRQTSRMQTLVEDLLSLSAIEYDTDRGAIEIIPGRISDIISRVVHLYLEKATEKNMEIYTESDDSLMVPVNESLLVQAIGNLLDNAIKYSGDGKKITLKAKKKDNLCEIMVCDNGQGIPPEHLPHLFQRFYRVDKARSRDEGGTGLGLAIVKHIIMAHHGQVSVESTVGKGSCFIIKIPLNER